MSRADPEQSGENHGYEVAERGGSGGRGVSLWELHCSAGDETIAIRVGDWGDALSVAPAWSSFAKLLPMRVVGFVPPGADAHALDLAPLRMTHVEQQNVDLVGLALVLQRQSVFVSDAVVREPLRRRGEVTPRG